MKYFYRNAYNTMKKFKCSEKTAIHSELRSTLSKPNKQIRINLGFEFGDKILNDYFKYQDTLKKKDDGLFFSVFKFPDLYETGPHLSNRKKGLLIKKMADNPVSRNGLVISKLIERHSLVSKLKKYIEKRESQSNTLF